MGSTYPESDGGKGQPDFSEPPKMQFTCPHCQAVLAIAASKAGETAVCPHCQGKFQIPVPQAYANPYASAGPTNINYPPDYQSFVSKKIAAGICGILLGAFGVHKFILGLNSGGAVMVSIYVVCLISGMCLVIPIIGCLAISVIGLVEGILYLTKTDEEFYQAYAVEKRQWF